MSSPKVAVKNSEEEKHDEFFMLFTKTVGQA